MNNKKFGCNIFVLSLVAYGEKSHKSKQNQTNIILKDLNKFVRFLPVRALLYTVGFRREIPQISSNQTNLFVKLS